MAAQRKPEACSTLVGAVAEDLARMDALKRSPALARLALTLAEAIDRRPSALMAKELRDTLTRLAEVVPVKREEGPLDDLRARRAARRAGGAAAKGL